MNQIKPLRLATPSEITQMAQAAADRNEDAKQANPFPRGGGNWQIFNLAFFERRRTLEPIEA